MGSWYKTCGISKLHIRDYDEVMVFVLEQNRDLTDRCYSTAFWKPLMMPFYSKYGDYGRGQDDSGACLPYVMAGIKKELVETEEGENKYHDIAVKRDKFDIELFYEAVHENRLFKAVNWGGVDQVPLDFVMIRKDIADDILTNFHREVYVGGGKGDCGYENNYRKVTFAGILEDLPAYMEELTKMIKDDEDHMFLFRDGLDILEYGHPNRVNAWMRGDNYRFCQVVRVKHVIEELIKEDKIDEATAIIVDFLKAKYIDCFMEVTRSNWAPGGHEGSQNNEHHGYRVLARAINCALEREKQEYLDEVDDEFSEF
jgi:hypothetical protein